MVFVAVDVEAKEADAVTVDTGWVSRMRPCCSNSDICRWVGISGAPGMGRSGDATSYDGKPHRQIRW